MELRNYFEFLEDEISAEEYDRHNDIESWLYNYKVIEVAIENLKQELYFLDTLKSPDMGSEGKASGRVSSCVEDIQAKKDKIEKRIAVMEFRMNKINKSLNTLKSSELYLIKSFYIEGKRYKEFIKDMKCTEDNCKKLKKKILNKIVMAVYGGL